MNEAGAVLIVEDQGLIALLLRASALSVGFSDVALATDGHAALSIAKATNPDLVIMDVGLDGDMDGIETARRLADFSNAPIIFLSGNVGRESECSDLRQRTWFVGKPFPKEELETLLRDVRTQLPVTGRLDRSG